MVEVRKIWDKFCEQGDYVCKLAMMANDKKTYEECNVQFMLFLGMYKMISQVDRTGYPLGNAPAYFQHVSMSVKRMNERWDVAAKEHKKALVEKGRKRREAMKEVV